ncbi:hypothetical protein ACWDYJ_24500 [Streptomyces sp. NPDC003042]
MTALEDHGPQCTPGELRRLEEHLPAEVRARALSQRIYAFIEHNLSDPELTPSIIAARHNISVSDVGGPLRS